MVEFRARLSLAANDTHGFICVHLCSSGFYL